MNFFLKKELSGELLRFLLKTIVFYVVFDNFFVAYTGLTVEGGRLYSAFVAEHLDFISLFRRFLLWGGAHFATLIGYPSDYSDYFLIVRGGSRVHIVYSCLGLSLISAYGALVLAWPAERPYKLASLIIGVAIINMLNMIRLGGLAVLYTAGNYGFFKHINHHDLFNVVTMTVVFVMFVVHSKYSEVKAQS